MNYPGRIIKMGEKDATIVRAIKIRLNEMVGTESNLNIDDPTFGQKMKQVVKLFQARHVDSMGRPLSQDGEIGSLTWSALFGTDMVQSNSSPASPYLGCVLAKAAEQEAKQVREVPVNSNRGPEVEEYLERAGVEPGNPWCCAFVYWCFDEAAASSGRENPMVQTAGCLDHWNRAVSHGGRLISAGNAVANPGLVAPGMVFIMDHGSGKGHTGLVEKVEGGLLTTIEGNTDGSKTREGGGVYRLVRKIGEINKGFIDYSAA